MAEIAFGALPTIGTILLVDKQPFELVRIEPHERRDGSAGQLLIWRSSCIVCGEIYETTSGLGVFRPTRRCADHRQRSYARRKAKA